jgi:hypothetical protein
VTDAREPKAEPRAVLFACNWNTVRSPMAAALLRQMGGGRIRVDSCGLQAGESVDPFAFAGDAGGRAGRGRAPAEDL